MKRNLEELKREYEATPIPDALADVVRAAHKKPRHLAWKAAAISAACVLVLFTAGVNTIPALAAGLEDVPVLGTLAKVLCVKNYVHQENGYSADVKIAKVEGLGNPVLEKTINDELEADAQKFWEDYRKDVDDLKAEFGEEEVHMGIESNYEVLANNDDVFSLRVYYYFAAGSGNVVFKYYNVNRATGELFTLDDLFAKDYLPTLNKILREQMSAQKDEQGNCIYGFGEGLDGIEDIDGTHNFYVNADGKLVISYDKYEIAAGCYGTPEFVIPTERISDLLAFGAPLR